MCLARSAVPLQQRQSSLAGCANKSWSQRQRALGEVDELEQQPGWRIHPHPLAAPVSCGRRRRPHRATVVRPQASPRPPCSNPPALMLPERHLQQCQRRQVSVQLNSLPAAAVHPCSAQQLRFYFLRPAGGRGRGAPAPRRPHVGREHRCSRRPRRVNEKRDPQQLAR